MIKCDICEEYHPAEEMYVVGPFPLFTYFDNSFCRDCLCPFLSFIDSERYKIEIEEPYERKFYYTNYKKMRDSLVLNGSKQGCAMERECPICGGIMGEGYNEEWDCLSFTCLNCGYEFLTYEVEIRRSELNETRCY
jgi:hypothetical protein